MNKYKVNIKQVDWLDKDNPEAEILFEIGGKNFWAFCHPCDFKEGEITEVYFSFIEEEIAEASFWNENSEHKSEMVSLESTRCYYYCYGQLKSIHPVTVDCNVIAFSFGDWINDTNVLGSYVYFVISRLDIHRI